jgi:Ca-activated chloride channel family protein
MRARMRATTSTSGPRRIARGTSRYKAGDLEGALAAYRAALGADPGDEDARFNYEKALRQLQAAQQQKQNPSEGQKDKQEQKPEAQDSQGSKQNPDSTQAQQGEQGKKEEKDTPREQQQTAKQEAGQGKQQPADPARMLTPEQAAQLLDQVTPEERGLIEARLKAARRRPAEKDW